MNIVRPVNEPLQRPIRLGVLISGGGTTLLNFIDQIDQGRLKAEVAVVVASRPDCAGIARAERAGLQTHVVARQNFKETEAFSRAVFDRLRAADVDLVTLAGFLSLLRIPKDFEHRVLNIHPALIPSFCGKGLYGHHVHEAVLSRGAKVSGCTVHFADNVYDHGPIVVQRCVPVHEGDTPESLAARVFEAECEAYPGPKNSSLPAACSSTAHASASSSKNDSSCIVVGQPGRAPWPDAAF
jgi:formyltetrahydrofolate-dependent phosphoribosylglycinamide formyltransferase